jgi:uncharacterized protein YcbK (DUF882 family)
MDKKSFEAQLKADSVHNGFKIENNYVVFDKSAKLSYKILPDYTLGDLLTKNPLSSYTKLNKDLLLRLHAITKKIGRKLNINSWFRSFEYNKTIPGSSDTSRHVKGDAVDLGDSNTAELSEVIKSFGYSGELGIYNTFCHIAVGSSGTWDKRSKEFIAKAKEMIVKDSNRNLLMIIIPSLILFFLIKRKFF